MMVTKDGQNPEPADKFKDPKPLSTEESERLQVKSVDLTNEKVRAYYGEQFNKFKGLYQIIRDAIFARGSNEDRSENDDSGPKLPGR